jgi:type IV secretion system protein VirB9
MKKITTPLSKSPTYFPLRWLACCRTVATFLCVLLTVTQVAGTSRGYVYQPGKVYTVNSALGVATQIVIDPEERVLDFGTGFSAGWDLVRRENIFYIKPKDPDAETNMYVRTDRRSYLFDLRVVSKDWRNIDDAKSAGVHYVVQFVYSDDKSNKSSAQRANAALAKLEPPKLDVVETPDTRTVAPTGMSFEPDGRKDYHTRYEIAANDESKWLVPTRVYDDGKFTYLHFAQGTPTAAIFGRSALRAQEYVVNKTVASDEALVVHGIHPVVIVRYGNNTVAIRRR